MCGFPRFNFNRFLFIVSDTPNIYIYIYIYIYACVCVCARMEKFPYLIYLIYLKKQLRSLLSESTSSPQRVEKNISSVKIGTPSTLALPPFRHPYCSPVTSRDRVSRSEPGYVTWVWYICPRLRHASGAQELESIRSYAGTIAMQYRVSWKWSVSAWKNRQQYWMQYACQYIRVFIA